MPSGAKMRCVEEFVERHAGYDLEHAAERLEACAGAVGPARAGLELERRAAEARDVVGQRFAVAARDGLDRGVAHRAAAEARDVRQQILDRDLALRGTRVEARRRAAAAFGPCDGDAQIAELRNVARHGVAQAQLVLLDHHHDADADDRLRHRCDAKQRVGAHRLPRFEVHDAVRRDVSDFAAARDDGDGADEVARGDAPLEHGVDALEPLARQAYVLGIGAEGEWSEGERCGRGRD